MRAFESAVRGVPRPLELAERLATDVPPGYRRISSQEAARRLAGLVDLYASGQVPLDEAGARAVAMVLDAYWRRAQGLRR